MACVIPLSSFWVPPGFMPYVCGGFLYSRVIAKIKCRSILWMAISLLHLGKMNFCYYCLLPILLRTIFAYSIYTAVKRITLLIQSLTNSFDTLIF